LRVLIADDHAAFRTLLSALLATLRTEVVECRDGREAVARFHEFAPDWVLMDLDMPCMDGLSATMQILAASPQARVLILTQHDGEDAREAAREAGAREFLAKDKLELLPAILFPNQPNDHPSVSVP
jgi:CheY-like chemotaxis protein